MDGLGGGMRLPGEKGAARSALTVALMTLVGEIAAYLGDLAFASHYGATAISDAYLAAGGLLSLPLMLLAAGAGATFMPHYLKRQGRQADEFASNLLGIYGGLALVGCLLTMALARPLAWLLHPGFDRARLDMAVAAARVMLPALPLLALSLLLGQILEAHGRFLAAQAAALPRSLLLAVACVFFARPFGLWAVAFSVLAAGVVQAVMLWLLARSTFRFRPYLNLRADYLGQMARQALPALISMGAGQVNMAVSHALASGLAAGQLTSMSLSMQLVMLLNTLLTLPLTTVMFPRMSRMAAAGDRQGALKGCAACVRYILAFLIPAVCVGCACPGEIVQLAYGWGAFGRDSVALTASLFALHLPGALGMGLRMLFTSAFHALSDTRTPLYAGLGGAAVNLGLCLALVPALGVRGLALASTLSSLLCALFLGCALARTQQGGVHPFSGPLKRLALPGLLCLLAALGLRRLLPSGAPALPALLLCALPAWSLYCLALIPGSRAAPFP